MPLQIVSVSADQFRVIETYEDSAGSLILRTLPTRSDAEAFAAAISHNPRKR